MELTSLMWALPEGFVDSRLLDFDEVQRLAASGSKCNSQLIMLSRLVASSCR